MANLLATALKVFQRIIGTMQNYIFKLNSSLTNELGTLVTQETKASYRYLLTLAEGKEDQAAKSIPQAQSKLKATICPYTAGTQNT